MKKILLRILSPLHKPVLLRGRMSKRGVGRGFNPPCTTFQNGLARFPFFPDTEQWRLKPLFLVELTLASVLRESSEILASFQLNVIFSTGLIVGMGAAVVFKALLTIVQHLLKRGDLL